MINTIPFGTVHRQAELFWQEEKKVSYFTGVVNLCRSTERTEAILPAAGEGAAQAGKNSRS